MIHHEVRIKEWDAWDVEVITEIGVHITRRGCFDQFGIPGDKLIKSEPSGKIIEIWHIRIDNTYDESIYILRYNTEGYIYDLPYLSDYWIGKYRELMGLCYEYPYELSRFLPDLIRFLHEYDTSGEEVLRL